MPVHGVGVDIVDVARVARLLARGGSFTRWFSDDESERCGTALDPARAYAKTLAAKEAAWKSLGISWAAGVPWRSVLVADDGTVSLDGAVAGAARAAGVGATRVTGLRDTPGWGPGEPERGVSRSPVTPLVIAYAVSYR